LAVEFYGLSVVYQDGPTLFYIFAHASANTRIYTLSLHDALPISEQRVGLQTGEHSPDAGMHTITPPEMTAIVAVYVKLIGLGYRSEEHTSELQSLRHLVCRLLLEKKNKKYRSSTTSMPTTKYCDP